MIVEHNIIRYTSGSDDRRKCAQCDHLRGWSAPLRVLEA